MSLLFRLLWSTRGFGLELVGVDVGLVEEELGGSGAGCPGMFARIQQLMARLCIQIGCEDME